MLTLEELKTLKENTIFASGTFFDKDQEREVRWVAIRGWIPDWAIYKDNKNTYSGTLEDISELWDKIYSKNIIKSLVECNEEALNWYRD